MAALDRICRWLVIAGAGALVALLVTGAWLTRFYRPAPSLGGLYRRFPATAVAIGVHRGAAGVLLLAMSLVLGVRLASSARRAGPAALTVLAAVVLIATGWRLAWRQLALRAVKANLDGSGMLFAAFDPTVRFVLGPSTGEISPATFRLWLGAHALAGAFVLGGLLRAGRQRARDTPVAPGT